MRLLYNRLKDYIELDLSAHEVKELLERIGIEVEDFRDLSENLEGKIFPAVVVESEKHGRLNVAKVQLPDGSRKQVVVGVDVHPGEKVVYASVGTILPDGTEVGTKEIRGYLSEGMLLSEQELSLAERSEDILRLPENYNLQDNVLSFLHLDDYLYELYITPNRPDLMGVIGIAHELAIFLGSKVIYPEVLEMGDNLEYEIVIDDKQACPRYTGRVIRNVSISDSPAWLRYTLHLVGFRAINNVVDITNFVLWETGHPLHAFDLDRIDERIVVRRAKEGEELLCLDGVKRKLDEDVLVIADVGKPLAIAGIIGGEESSVSWNTRNVFLESAYFDPKVIAKASRKLNVKTESSRRFERQADVEATLLASNRASYLIRKLAGGTIGKPLDVYPNKLSKVIVQVDVGRISSFLGYKVESSVVDELMSRMGAYRLEESRYEIPTRRRDIRTWQDVSEEVARFVGYDEIPSDPSACIFKVGEGKGNIYEQAISFLVSRGYYESKTWSLTSKEKALKFFKAPLEIANPLSAELSVFRPYIVTTLLEALSANLRKNILGGKFAEWGSIYRNGEELSLGLVVGGRRLPNPHSGETYDYYDLKGDVEALLEYFNLSYSFVKDELPFLRICASIIVDGRKVGFLGELRRSVLKMYDIKQRVFVAEISLIKPKTRPIEDIPKFVPAFRDISFIVPKETTYEEIRSFMESLDVPYLEGFYLKDVYEGDPIPQGFVSYTFNLIFRAKDRTLSDEEVNGYFKILMDYLEGRGWKVRR